MQVDNRTSWTSKNYHWNTRDGGFVGWGQRAWAVSARLATPDGPAVRLTYTSKDGDMVRPPPAWPSSIVTSGLCRLSVCTPLHGIGQCS